MKQQLIILGLIASTTFNYGFFGKKDVVAKVGSEVVTLTELNSRLSSFPEAYRSQLDKKENKVKVLNQMIDEKLLIAAAKKEGVERKSNYKDQLNTAKNQLLVNMLLDEKINQNLNVTDKDIRKFYDDNKSSFEPKEQRRVKHILVQDEQTAKKLRIAVKKGTSFDKLARENSIDTETKSAGGDVGWFSKGEFLPAFETAAFSLKKSGDLSPIVKSDLGYHIIRLEDKQMRPEVAFEQIKTQLRQQVESQNRRTLTNEYLESLKARFKITRDLSKVN